MSSSFDLENGLLSYTNPNYQLKSSDENCNISADDDYEDILEGVDISCRANRRPGIQNRRKYATLDPVSMGVDVSSEEIPMLSINPEDNINESEDKNSPIRQKSFHIVDNGNSVLDSNDNNDIGKRSSISLDYIISFDSASKKHKKSSSLLTVSNNDLPSSVSPLTQKECSEETDDGSKNFSDSVCQYQSSVSENTLSSCTKYVQIPDEESESLLNIPVRFSGSSSPDKFSSSESSESDSLPSGWEKHEDDSGPYYWHISSGTIQREPPVLQINSNRTPTRLSRDLDLIAAKMEYLNSYKTSSYVCYANDSSCDKMSVHSVDGKFKRRSCPDGSCSLTPDKRPIRFAVRSLGWVEIDESDLTPERSSKAVNKCIVDLSIGRNDILDVVGRWGDGKDLFMDLDDYSLRLLNTQDLTVLNTQPIHTIRVWGVGRDNGRERDFAYVARDRATRKHMCHVFRCDIPARIIANTLRDICKKIMIERSLQHNLEKEIETSADKTNKSHDLNQGLPNRPTNLPVEHNQFQPTDSQNIAEFFPTPMEEPKKVLKVHYLGSTNVEKATGVDVLNNAIEKLAMNIPKAGYKYVNVAVAPSTITISEPGDDGKQLAECRVRFLSFLGIGKNVKHCGFIVHTAQDDFVAHVFYCEPSSGALCKTIEAACKLRYQKCLDAHRQDNEKKFSETQKKSFGTALKNVFGTFFLTRLAKSSET